MKLLVFAHTPPPHHGQSYMVQLMLAGLGGDHRNRRAVKYRPLPPHPPLPQMRKGRGGGGGRGPSLSGAHPPGGGLTQPRPGESLGIECYHVNVRLSQKLEEIGDFRIGKFILLLGYCLQAIWCRFRYGVKNFYYIPAPGKRSALYRDWLVMLLCRRFFKRIILHWHAAGLAKWLETTVQIRTRSLTYRLLKQVDLSIVLSEYNRADAEKLFSRKIKIVSNGIPDPCPNFASGLLPRRKARFAARQKLFSGQRLTPEELSAAGGDPETIKVLYLAHCTREKGLFEAVSGVTLANEELRAKGSAISFRLSVTGTFVTEQEKNEFEAMLAQPGANHLSPSPPTAPLSHAGSAREGGAGGEGHNHMIQYLGFVSGERKHEILREADLFCFPTYYQNENQPVNLIEAMAFGLPILTTRWRSIPELFPVSYPGLVDIRSPEQVAGALLKLASEESGEGFRQIFLNSFTLERHLAGLAEACHKAEGDESAETKAPSSKNQAPEKLQAPNSKTP